MRSVLAHKSPLVALCAWCIALLAVRALYAGHLAFTFMVWNLFLAVVPVGAALALRALPARRTPALKIALFALWLAFLPNAPYLVTDFVHLRSRPPVPLWFDLALFGSFAATGVLLGYSSVADVEAVVSERFGRAISAIVALGSLALCGFGIYLGRFLGWNSWDIATEPVALARQLGAGLLDPLAHERAWIVSLIYGLALVLGYIALNGYARSLPVRRQASS